MGGDLSVETADHVGPATFLCPAGQVFFFDACYDQCPAGSVQVGTVCTHTIDGEDQGPWGCESGERDNLLGACYACPSGFYRDALGFCRDDANRIDEGKASVSSSCPSGYNNVGVTCEKRTCPSGYSYNSSGVPLVSDCKKRHTHQVGVCPVCWDDTHNHYKGSSLSTRSPTITLGCNWSDDEWLFGDSCYSCPNGYSNNGIGGCTKTTSDVYAHDYWCSTDEITNLVTGRCFTCDAGYGDNGFGQCVNVSSVERAADVTLLCPSGQFPSSPFEDFSFDSGLSTPECYECQDGYDHNPVLGVDDTGVCFALEFEPDNPSAPFQLGMQVDYDHRFRWGVDGGITLDPGTVTVDYDPRVEVTLERPPEEPGPELITLKTKQVASASTLDMDTTWPAITMWVDSYLDASATMSGYTKYTEITPTGIVQHSDDFDVFDVTSDGEKRIADDPIAEFRVAADGLSLDVLGEEIFGFDGGLDPPVEIAQPVLLLPGGADIGIVLVELGVTTPDMATPTDHGYDGISNSESMITSGPGTYANNFVGPGPRLGADFGILSGGAQDPDIGRFDLDLDGMYAFSSGTPLGFKFKWPTPIPLVNFASLSASVYDLDGGMIFSFQEDFLFEPNLKVRVGFSKPVEAETAPGREVYIETNSLLVEVGTDVKFFHPGGELHITTEYTVSDNSFINDTDLMLTPILEGQWLALSYDFLFRPSDMPNHFAALQTTLDLLPQPIKIADLTFDGSVSASQFPLSGFEDQSGSTLYVIGRNQPPVAACQDASVDLEATGELTLSSTLIDGGSSDPDAGDSLTLSLSQYQVACTDLDGVSVELTVTDLSGESDSCTAHVSVNDVTNPEAVAGGPYTGVEGSPIRLLSAGSNDACGPLGFAWDFGDGSSAESIEAEHSYCDEGEYSVSLRVTDGSGNQSTQIADAAVSNVAPTLDAGANLVVDEGSVVSLTNATFSDPGNDSHSATIAWTTSAANGTIEQSQDEGCGTSGTISSDHVYTDNGIHTVLVTVNDGDNGVTTDSVEVIVNNVAPLAEAGSDVTVDEGSEIIFGGSFADPGNDTHTIEWDFGDGNTAEGSLSPTHAYADNGTYAVTLTVTDDDNGSGSDSLTVTVHNVAPSVSAGSNQSSDEGSSITLAAEFSDPGSADTHSIAIDFGDGSAPTSDLSASHIYADNGIYTVTVAVTDDDGGIGEDTIEVEVANVAPLISPLDDQQIYSGDIVSFEASFTDVGLPDTHIATVDWGTGVSNPLPVNQSPGAGTTTGANTFTELGIHTVSVTVVDDDDGVSIQSFFVEVSRLPVSLDVKPGSDDNPINLKSNGVIPVAVLTTESFNALDIDPSTLRLGPTGATIAHTGAHAEDVDDDGRTDLVSHYRTQEVGLESGNTSIELIGSTTDGRHVQGIDNITTNPPNDADDSNEGNGNSGNGNNGNGKGKGKK